MNKKVLSDSKQEDKCDIYMVLVTTVLIFISHVDGSMKFGDTEGPLSLHVRVCMCFVCVTSSCFYILLPVLSKGIQTIMFRLLESKKEPAKQKQ